MMAMAGERTWLLDAWEACRLVCHSQQNALSSEQKSDLTLSMAQNSDGVDLCSHWRPLYFAGMLGSGQLDQAELCLFSGFCRTPYSVVLRSHPGRDHLRRQKN